MGKRGRWFLVERRFILDFDLEGFLFLGKSMFIEAVVVGWKLYYTVVREGFVYFWSL